jgi:hypothetical protein
LAQKSTDLDMKFTPIIYTPPHAIVGNTKYRLWSLVSQNPQGSLMKRNNLKLKCDGNKGDADRYGKLLKRNARISISLALCKATRTDF